MTRVTEGGPDGPRPDLGEVLASLRLRLDAAKVYLRLDDSIERLGVLEKSIQSPTCGRTPTRRAR